MSGPQELELCYFDQVESLIRELSSEQTNRVEGAPAVIDRKEVSSEPTIEQLVSVATTSDNDTQARLQAVAAIKARAQQQFPANESISSLLEHTKRGRNQDSG